MPTAVVTLNPPTVKTGNGARGPWALSIFEASDGREYTTLDGALATTAAALAAQGSPVRVEYKERQNGKFTNYDLKGIEPAGEGAVPTQAAPTQAAAPKGEYRTKEQILYSTALGVAVSAFGHAGLDPVVQTDDLYQLADEFYAKLQTFA